MELDHSQIDTDNFKKCLTKKFLIKIGDFECARINSPVGTKPTIGWGANITNGSDIILALQ